MADRVRQTKAQAGAGERPVALPKSVGPGVGRPGAPAGLKHCWVLTPDGPVPGLLVGWRRDAALGWLGRVIRPVRGEDGWLVTEDWMPAMELRPAPGDPPES
ncbi:MAG TPA: hypothetical protein VFT75_05560 [Nocardioidaceae bacterium]|nr:hypothetical protein [Nocardioidaceae bacterium]